MRISLFVACVLLLGCVGTDDRQAPMLPTSVEPQGRNDFGYREFLHQGIGIVFVEIPSDEHAGIWFGLEDTTWLFPGFRPILPFERLDSPES